MDKMEKKQSVERRSFNDVLKEKEARQALEKKNDDGHIALDDAKRIKVLSPGQLVFKRFIRNKLAIFGTVVIVIMFLFSFLAPVFYTYGETQTFYKYDTQYKAMAVATVRTDYENFEINPEIKVDSYYKNNVTSTVKKIDETGVDYELIISKDRKTQFVLTKLYDKLFSLAPNNGALIGSAAANLDIAELLTKQRTFTYSGKQMDEGFEAAALEAFDANQDTFSYDGVDYTLKRVTKLEYKIVSSGVSVVYEGTALGSDFEDAVLAALENEENSFNVGEVAYRIYKDKGVNYIYSVIPGDDAMISTTMEYSGVHKGENDFMLELYHSLDARTFTVNGETYTIEADKENGVFVSFSVKDATGEEVGLLSDFVINAPDGTDTVSLANKEVIQDKVLEIIKNKMDVPAEEEDPDAEEPAPVEDEEIDEEELNPEGGDEESAANAKGVPIDLIFPKRVAGFNGVEPTLTQEYDENGEPVMGTMPGRVVTKISTTTLNGVTQEYKYYYISCDQWQWLMDTNGRPTGRHILGTDTDGYDVLARIMYGGRISLLVGFIVVFIETLLGVIMGGIAGYFGGWVDNLIMRLVDIFYCIPSMPILIILGAFMDDRGLKPIPRLIWMMAILGFLGWAGIARLVRGQILSLREQEFMVATEATGVKVSRRIFRHLIPNVMPQLIVSATAGLGGVILTESTLSFLGLGVKRPMATWGTIISAVTSSNENILNFTYIWIPVGLLICLTVIAFNFVGDGLRDAFDPKMKR